MSLSISFLKYCERRVRISFIDAGIRLKDKSVLREKAINSSCIFSERQDSSNAPIYSEGILRVFTTCPSASLNSGESSLFLFLMAMRFCRLMRRLECIYFREIVTRRAYIVKLIILEMLRKKDMPPRKIYEPRPIFFVCIL